MKKEKMKRIDALIHDYKNLIKELENDAENYHSDDYEYVNILDKIDLIECFIKDVGDLK